MYDSRFPRASASITDSSSRVSGGAIVGIIVTILFLVIPIIICIVVFCIIYKKRQRTRVANPGMILTPYPPPVAHVNPDFHYEQQPPSYSEIFNKNVEAMHAAYPREGEVTHGRLPPLNVHAPAP